MKVRSTPGDTGSDHGSLVSFILEKEQVSWSTQGISEGGVQTVCSHGDFSPKPIRLLLRRRVVVEEKASSGFRAAETLLFQTTQSFFTIVTEGTRPEIISCNMSMTRSVGVEVRRDEVLDPLSSPECEGSQVSTGHV